MQPLEVSGAVRPIYGSLGFKRLMLMLVKFPSINLHKTAFIVFRVSADRGNDWHAWRPHMHNSASLLPEISWTDYSVGMPHLSTLCFHTANNVTSYSCIYVLWPWNENRIIYKHNCYTADCCILRNRFNRFFFLAIQSFPKYLLCL